MSDKKLVVTISGSSGSGKSALVDVIRNVLTSAGIQCVLDGTVLKDYGSIDRFQEQMAARKKKNIDILAENKTVVVIEENTTSKSFF